MLAQMQPSHYLESGNRKVGEKRERRHCRDRRMSSETVYYPEPNLRDLDPSAAEMEVDALVWVRPTLIDDDDLTFGGKSLSAWYEEERRRLSSGSMAEGRGRSDDDEAEEEEERRGRERTRKRQDGEQKGS